MLYLLHACYLQVVADLNDTAGQLLQCDFLILRGNTNDNRAWASLQNLLEIAISQSSSRLLPVEIRLSVVALRYHKHLFITLSAILLLFVIFSVFVVIKCSHSV